MKAVVMTAAGNPEVLQPRDIPTPTLPDDNHCLVRLAAAGVNPIDCRIRRLHMFHPKHFPAVLGFDGAGVVEKCGSACKRFKTGDAVYFFNGGLGGPQGGTYAEYAVVREDYLARKPQGITMHEAAALPLVLITAWEALVFRAQLEAGQRVLIHGGAGGVGHVAIQLARHLRARVAATVSSDAKAKFVRAFGAELAIDYTQQDFVAATREWTDRDGADVVLDTVGGDTFLRSIDAVRLFGRLVTLLSTPIDLAHANKARGRNILIGYEGMVTAAVMDHHRARLAQTRILEQGARLVEQGKLKLVVSEVLPLEHAAEAHEQIETGHTQGKLVLDIA